MRASLETLGLWFVGFVAVSAFVLLALTFQSWPAQAHNASVFCDRRTATGSMDCGAMVFAHRTLPLGSHHRVTCNGRVVVARVVDRGPAKWTGRDFDLSPGLARFCGINGVGNVRLASASYYNVFPIPRRFNYEPRMRVNVHRMSPEEIIWQCGLAYACTKMGTNPCQMYLPRGRAAYFWHHERAHCNGWPPDHPYP